MDYNGGRNCRSNRGRRKSTEQPWKWFLLKAMYIGETFYEAKYVKVKKSRFYMRRHPGAEKPFVRAMRKRERQWAKEEIRNELEEMAKFEHEEKLRDLQEEREWTAFIAFECSFPDLSDDGDYSTYVYGSDYIYDYGWSGEELDDFGDDHRASDYEDPEPTSKEWRDLWVNGHVHDPRGLDNDQNLYWDAWDKWMEELDEYEEAYDYDYWRQQFLLGHDVSAPLPIRYHVRNVERGRHMRRFEKEGRRTVDKSLKPKEDKAA